MQQSGWDYTVSTLVKRCFLFCKCWGKPHRSTCVSQSVKVSYSWFELKSWTPSHEIKSCVSLCDGHGACLKVFLLPPFALPPLKKRKTCKTINWKLKLFTKLFTKGFPLELKSEEKTLIHKHILKQRRIPYHSVDIY